MNFIVQPATLAKVERELRLDEQALRWLVVKKRASLAEGEGPASTSTPSS